MKKENDPKKEKQLTEIHHFDKVGPSLEEAQKIVGGPVEIAPTPAHRMNIQMNEKQMILVNENGKLLDLPYNKLASYIAGMHLLGNAIILTGDAVWR